MTYPVHIIQDRYSGTYSGGAWCAVSDFNDHRDIFDDGPDGGDIECMDFWSEPPDWIAVGQTPNEALANLTIKMGKDPCAR